MTGAEVLRCRLALGMNPFAFAAMLGCHVSTVYRWEASKSRVVRMDPLQRDLIALITAAIGARSSARMKRLGTAVATGLIERDALGGLLVLLSELLHG